MSHNHQGDSPTEVPPGVAKVTDLPDAGCAAAWERMILDAGTRQRLLNWAILALRHGPRFVAGSSGLQRLLLFAGPPGTGKSTTARGLANAAVAAATSTGAGRLVEVDSTALPSDMLGQSQRNVAKLMQATIPALAAGPGPTIVLIDEVEAFAVSRTSASFETNPTDVHHATTAVLDGLDRVAQENPSVLILATTNFLGAVDAAVVSRSDWVLRFGLPDGETAAAIIRRSLAELTELWPALAGLRDDRQLLARLGATGAGAGLDGRTLYRLPTVALSLREAVAHEPGGLSETDLLDAAELIADEAVRFT